MKKAVILFVLIFCLAQALSAQTIDKIVAVVNNEIITQSDLDRVLAALEAEYGNLYGESGIEDLDQRLKQTKENLINQMIEEKLVLSEAKKYQIEVSEDEIEVRLEKAKASFESEEEFEQALAMYEITLEQLQERFRNQEIMKKAVQYFVRDKIKVSPIEVSQFYQEHQEELILPQKAAVLSIFIRIDEAVNEYLARQRAEEAFEQLQQGASLEQVAGAYSQDGVAADLGLIEQGQMIEEIDQAIFSLEPGQFSRPIKTASGYRIFKVTEKQTQEKLELSQARGFIEATLYERKFAQEFKKWINELKQNAYIVIKDE